MDFNENAPATITEAMSHEKLLRLLKYDPETGDFVWIARRCGVRVGTIAGSIDPTHGYRRIKFEGVLYLAHRLAWFYVHEDWPDEEIDHEDRNRLNNKIENLRLASHGQNQRNKPTYRNNKTRMKGVTWHKQHRKYCASIQVDKKPRHLGLFKNKEAAQLAYRKASISLHGEFALYT